MQTLAFAGGIQLFPDGTIFIHIGLIILMIWVLNRTFFKPINRVLTSREKNSRIEGGEAGEILREAAEKEARFASELRSAREEGYSLIEKVQAEASSERAEKLAEAKAEAAAAFDAGKSEIERQAAEARLAAAAEADILADRIAETVLKA
jgi:F-type H+-transporting ATPase subunit b